MVYHVWFWPLNFKKDVDGKDTGEPGSVVDKENESRGILLKKEKLMAKKMIIFM